MCPTSATRCVVSSKPAPGSSRSRNSAFPGHAVTGRALVGAIARTCGRGFKVSGMPWTLLRMLGIVVPIFRELSEVAYLWSTPHAIDGTRLATVIGDLPHTPLDRAVASTLLRLGIRRRPEGSR